MGLKFIHSNSKKNRSVRFIFLKVEQCQPHEYWGPGRHCFKVVNQVKAKPRLAGNQIPFRGTKLGFV
jgi:hypothetical protein